MRDFFNGWRRKVGVVSLVMAAAFTSGWCRSLATDDYVIAFRLSLISTSGSSYFARQVYSDRRLFVWESGSGLFPVNMATCELSTLGAPYSIVAIPLALLSAYLLLWNPRKRMGPEHA